MNLVNNSDKVCVSDVKLRGHGKKEIRCVNE